MDDLLQEFTAETLESLEALSSEVVAWEHDPSDMERLDKLFRFFHTVKGSCGFLDLPRFERLAHAAEDVLDTVRRGQRQIDGDLVSAVLAVMDRITELTHCLDQRIPLPESSDDPLFASLRATVAADPAEQAEDPRTHQRESEPADTPQSGEGQTSEALSSDRRDGGQRTIRVPVTLIEQMMNSVSDMVLARNEVSRKMRGQDVYLDLESSFERLSACVADIRDLVSKTRMQRVDRLFQAIPRLVRDLCRDLGKQIDLSVDGGDVEMDREMIELVIDPLTHIVRNALDHGIETPEERRARGKPVQGRLSIAARQAGNRILIEVTDDGRGINVDALVSKAIQSGIVTAEDAARMDVSARMALIFRPGLSTAKTVTSISGRGVGMDVVRANVERIGGVVTLDSAPGRGTTFRLRVPLTLTIIPGLTLRCGQQSYAIPRANVIEILHDNNAMVQLEDIAGTKVATIRSVRHAYVDLEEILGIPKRPMVGPRSILVVRSASGQPYALGIEAVDNHEEMVIRPASPIVMQQGIFAGMTLPDSGQPMLLLDAFGIASEMGLTGAITPSSQDSAEPAADGDGIERQDALQFRELSGEERLMPLPVIVRVEDVDAGSLSISGGRRFLRHNDALIPAFVPPNAELPDHGMVKALHLSDGSASCYYLVHSIVDVVTVPVAPDVLIPAGHVAGLCIVGDRSIEMVDAFAVFAATVGGMSERSGLRCRISATDDPWMRNLLAPLLVQAGYCVSFDSGPAHDDDWDVMLTTDAAASAVADKPTVVLADDPASAVDGAVHRYDRDALLRRLSMLAREKAA